MAFNHYAKIKQILLAEEPGWYIKRINEPTSAKMFDGSVRKYDYFYRIYDHNDVAIKYCKFQQIDRLSNILEIPVHELPIVD